MLRWHSGFLVMHHVTLGSRSWPCLDCPSWSLEDELSCHSLTWLGLVVLSRVADDDSRWPVWRMEMVWVQQQFSQECSSRLRPYLWPYLWCLFVCVCIGVFVYVIIFPLLSLFVIRSEYCPFYTKKGGICEGVYMSPVRVFVKTFIFHLYPVYRTY